MPAGERFSGTAAAAPFVVSDVLHGEQWEPHFRSPGVTRGLWTLFETAAACLSSEGGGFARCDTGLFRPGPLLAVISL